MNIIDSTLGTALKAWSRLVRGLDALQPIAALAARA